VVLVPPRVAVVVAVLAVLVRIGPAVLAVVAVGAVVARRAWNRRLGPVAVVRRSGQRGRSADTREQQPDERQNLCKVESQCNPLAPHPRDGEEIGVGPKSCSA